MSFNGPNNNQYGGPQSPYQQPSHPQYQPYHPYGQPAYGQPGYGQPAYGQPGSSHPAYGQPVSYGQPQYQPVAQAPPQYPQPAYGQPSAPPQYGTPAPVPQYQPYIGGGPVGDVEKQQPSRIRTSSQDEATGRFEYSSSRCNDVFFALLFIAHFIGVLVLVGLVGKATIADLDQGEESSTPIAVDIRQVLQSLMAAAAASFVFAAFWLSVMKRCSDTIIKCAFFINIVMLLLSLAACLVSRFIVGAIVFGIMAGFTILYYCAVRSRIPFTQAVIRVALVAIQTHPGPIAVSYVLAVLQIGWLALWSFATLCVYHLMGSDQTGARGLVYFVCLISLYWTCQVLKNVGHVTTSGTVATWWLVPANTRPTMGSLKRACTTSFGSICFGSLIVAVLEALRNVLQQVRLQAQRSDNVAAVFVLCCAQCVLGCVESLIAFMNKYAYKQIAIYGKDFISAARDTWELFKARNFDLLINDDLTGVVLTLGCTLGGVVAGAVGGAIAYMTVSNTGTWQVLAGVSFLLGMLMTALLMSVVESAVATTYVVWAQCPNELAQVRPEEFHRLQDVSHCRYPDRVF